MISKTYLENGTVEAIYQNETTLGVVAKYYNGQLAPLTTNSVALGANNKLTLKVSVSKLDLFNGLNSVKLSILPNIIRYDKPIKLSLETGFSSNTGNYIEDFVRGESDRYEVDITKYVVGKEEETFYFGISSENSYPIAIQSYDAPYIKVNYLELVNSLKNRKMLEGCVGDKTGYGVDIRNGSLVISKSLYKLDGCLMPINLSLVYGSYNCDKTVEEGLPLGWKFNYFQKLTESSANTIIYLDSEGIMHEFKVSNVETKFYDSSGSGLILTKDTDGTYQITNGYNDYLLFNSSGYLTAIKKKIGNNYLITTLTYDSSNRLTTISDPMGNVVSLTYIGTTSIGISCTNNLNILVSFSDNKLIRVNEQPGRITEFSYTEDLVSAISSDNGEKTQFTFDERKRVLDVCDSVKKDDVDSILRKHTLEYHLYRTLVTNYHNVKMEYTFNEEGQVIKENEADNDGVYKELKKLEMEKTIISVKEENCVHYFGETIDIVDEEDPTSKEITLCVGSNLTLKPDTEYVVKFQYSLENVKTTELEGRHSFISIEQAADSGYVNLGNCAVNLKSEGSCYAAFKIRTLPEITVSLRLSMSHNQNVGTFSIGNIRIFEYIKNERKVCFNIGEEEVEPLNCEGINFYPRTTPFTMIQYRDHLDNLLIQNIKLYEDDMKENIKNCVLANGGRFDLWFNHKKGLLANVRQVTIFVDDSFGTELSNYKMCFLNETNDKMTFTYDDYSNSGSEANILRTEYQKVLFKGNFFKNSKVISRDYLPMEVLDFSGIKMTYTYNVYGKLLSETTSATGSDLFMTKSYTYTPDYKRLASEITTSNTRQPSTKSYEYNNYGLVSKVTMPNGLEYLYTYDSNTLKLIKISCSDSSITTENHMTYLKDLVSNMSHKGNVGYDFSYDKYNMVSSVRTNCTGTTNNFVTMSNEITTTFDESVIEFPNGYKEKVVVDKYGNVVKKLSEANGGAFTSNKSISIVINLM